jgi:hypothetical protein
MAVTYRGLYLVGNKRAKTVRAVQIVDAVGYGPAIGLYFTRD